MFPVNPLKEAALIERMTALGIKESDLQETFVRSSGKGGQHVNKTSTCVQLKHLPTGIEVKSQEDRSQSLNRYYARVKLCEIIENRIKGENSPKAIKIAKLRKQKDRRRRRGKREESIIFSKNLE
ncbi:MAG: peptide chain release factor-like protein [Thermodesulfovibrionales bacterium]|nr:peptide chain release factor-like protein [Thermodesulfovibrionales bacterium]